MEFTAAEVRLAAKGKVLGALPWSTIIELAADTREHVERRVTGTRILLLGAWALMAKKETVHAYLVIRDAGGDWIFAVPDISAIELRSGLVGLQKYVTAAPAPPPPPPPPPPAALPAPQSSADPAERLQRLRQLLDGGLITAEEYDARRQAILAEL